MIIQEGLQYFWMEKTQFWEHFRKWQIYISFFFSVRTKNFSLPKYLWQHLFKCSYRGSWVLLCGSGSSILDNTQPFIWKAHNKILALKQKNIIAHIAFMRMDSCSVFFVKKKVPQTTRFAVGRSPVCAVWHKTVLGIYI